MAVTILLSVTVVSFLAGTLNGYALGHRHGRQRARKVIEQGLLNGRVSMHGNTYRVNSVEFHQEAQRAPVA